MSKPTVGPRRGSFPGRAAATLAAAAAVVAVPAADPPAGKAARPPVVVDDFESYATDKQLAKAWYKPHHGAPIRQTLDPDVKGGGKAALKVEYHTTADAATHYAPICRVAKWDLSGCNAFRLWLKPDGSGRQLTIQLNIADKTGKNIHDLWEYRYKPAKGDSAPRLVTVPFDKLAHNTKYADSPDTSPVFKPEAVIEVAFYITGRDDEPGDGAYYFDDLAGVAVD